MFIDHYKIQLTFISTYNIIRRRVANPWGFVHPIESILCIVIIIAMSIGFKLVLSCILVFMNRDFV